MNMEVLDRQDALSLRLTCRQLCSISTPFVLCYYTHFLTLSQDGVGNSKSRLDGQPVYHLIPAALAPYITNVQLVISASTPHPHHFESSGPQGFELAWEELSHLTSVKFLGLSDHTHSQEGEEEVKIMALFDKVVTIVRTTSGQRLHRLHFYSVPNRGMTKSLTMLVGLSDLVLLGSWHQHMSAGTHGAETHLLALQIRDLIIQNRSTLRSFSVKLPWDIWMTLEDIFPPEAIELPALTDVTVQNVKGAIPNALASLPTLQRIVLSPPSRGDPPDMDNVWDAFRIHGVRIKEVDGDNLTTSSMTYLCSFSGLTNCWFRLSRSVGSTLASMFFDGFLPKHAPTLEILTLYYNPSSSEVNCDALAFSSRDQWFRRLPFPCLRYFGIYVPMGWDIDQSRCQFLLDEVQDFPKLETLSVQWPKYKTGSHTFDLGTLKPFATKTGRPTMFSVEHHSGFNFDDLDVVVGKLCAN